MTAIGISDIVSVDNFPTVQRVTGSVSVTNVVFSGTILVTGVVFPTPIIVSSTGSLGVAVQNFPALQQISGSVGITNVVPVTVQSLPNVTGSVNVTNSLFRITGSVGVDGITFPETLTTTGSVAVNNQVTVTVTSSLPVTFSGQAQVTGTVNLDRGNNAGVPLFIQGSISVTPPLVQAVTGSQLTGSTFVDRPIVIGAVDAAGIVRAIRVGQNGEVSVFTTGSLSTTVTNQVTVTTTGSLPVVFSGTAQVTGTVAIANQINVSATSSLPVTVTSQIGINNFPATQNISGSVSVYTQGAQLVSGTVSINSFPLVQAVTGSQLTGSTFADRPVVVAGVDAAGIVRGIRTGQNGEVSIFTTGSLSTAVTNQVTVTTTGSLPVVFSGIAQVTGTVGVTGSVAVVNQVNVSVTSSLPVALTSQIGVNNFPSTQNVSGSVSVYTQGPQQVSGTIGINNFPVVQAVSGSQLTGSTAVGFPVIVGGTDASGFVRGIRTGQNGEVSVFTTGSLSTTVSNQVTVTTTGSLPVVFSGTAQVTGTVAVTGSVGITNQVNVTVSSSLPVTLTSQVGVNNFPATQNISGSVSVFTQGAQLVSGAVNVGNWPPTIGVSSSFTLKVWDPGVLSVSGSQLTGSTATGFPVIVGGVDGAGYVKGLKTDVSGALSIFASSSLPVTGGVAVNNQVTVTLTSSLPVTFSGQTQVTGTVNLDRGNSSLVPLFIQGSISTTPALVTAVTGSQLTGSTFSDRPVVVGGVDNAGIVRGLKTDANGAVSIFASSSLPVAVVGQVTVTLTSSLPVSGTVNLDRGNNAGTPLFIQGSINTTPSLVQAVTGSQLTGSTFADRPVVVGGVDASSVVRGIRTGQNGEVSIIVTGSIPVVGSVNVFTQGAQQISGTVGVNNFPATQAVSGSQLTGSTFAGSPVVIGGIDAAGTIRGIRTGINGEVSVFATGSLPVLGSVSAYTQGAQFVSGVVSIGNWPSTIGVSSSFTLKIWDPGIMAISGSQLTGSTFGGSPIVVGGTDAAGVVRAIRTGQNGEVSVMTTGSLTVVGSVAVFTQGAQFVSGTVGVNNFPAIQAITGSVSIFSQGALLVSGSTLTKGTQGATGFSVQDLKDSGRKAKCFCTSSVSGVLGEALVTMQALSEFALSGSTASSFVATNGKTLRLQSMILTWNAVTAISGSVLCRFRVNSGAAVTAKSPSILALGVTAGGGSLSAPGINNSMSVMADFPDGFEISGSTQFGLTQQASTTATGFDVTIIGFEY